MVSTLQELNEKLVNLALDCRYDPLQFVQRIFPWEHGDLKSSKGPRQWQSDLLTDIRDHLSDPKTRHTPFRCAIASGHGIGKAQPTGLMLHTPDGLRWWGEIKVGDSLFDENGNAVKVSSVYDRGKLQVYTVHFDDGSSTMACGDHLWNVRGRHERRNKIDGWRTISTSDLMKAGIKRSNGVAKAKQWEIPIQGAARFPHKAVPISPYLLGVWLGDGCRNTSRVTSIDNEVIDRVRSLGDTMNVSHYQTWHVKGLARKLKGLGILDKYSYQKSVPVCYLENSIEVRSEVLRGLLDTDGECNKDGTIIFNSTSHSLATDIIWLARSLGGKAQMQPTVKKPKFPDKNGNIKIGRDCWRVTIQMPNGFKSFYITRKQERVKSVEHRYLARWIDRIEIFGESDCMCVKVDSTTGLYQTNDFIVTHNTAEISMIEHWAMSCFPDCKVVITANTEKQLMTKTMPEVTKWARSAFNAHWFKITATRIAAEGSHENTWRADAIPWSENNTEAFAGLHNEGKCILVIYDESSTIADNVWEVTEGALTDQNTVIIWLAFGNPTRNSGRFKECFGRFAHRWKTRHIDSRTVEGTNKELLDQWVEDYGEDSDFVRVRVKGEFPRAGSMQFISGDAVDKARRNEAVAYLDDPFTMSVDVARFGDDQTIISHKRGRDCRTIPWTVLRGADTMEVAARVADLWMQHKHDAVFVDGGGVGGGVVDRLRALRVPVIEVQFGAKADRAGNTGDGMIIYANKRAEMYGYMRDAMPGLAIPDNVDLAGQLTSIEFGYTMKDGKDAILLEKKSDMKKRGLPSPDMADSLALHWAYPVMPSSHKEQLTPGRATDPYAEYHPFSREAARKVGGNAQPAPNNPYYRNGKGM